MDSVNSKMPHSCLNEIKDLYNSHKKSKHTEKRLTEFIQLLEKEVKIIKDLEQTSNSKRNLYQNYASQQQQVLLKLLNVKDENTQLKQTLSNIESKITDIQNKCMADYVIKDSAIDNIKQDFLNELLKIRETTDDKLNQLKSKLNPTIAELKSILTEQDTVVKEQSAKIQPLQDEIKILKRNNAVNSEVYQQKLSERRREHLAELETWKMAELNQMSTNSSGKLYCYEQNREIDDYHNMINLYKPRNSYQELSSGLTYNSNFQNRRVSSLHRYDPIAPRRPNGHPPQPLASSENDFYGQNINAVDNRDVTGPSYVDAYHK